MNIREWAAEVRRLSLIVEGRSVVTTTPAVGLEEQAVGPGIRWQWKAYCQNVEKSFTSDSPSKAMSGLLLYLQNRFKNLIEQKQNELAALQSLENIAALKAADGEPQEVDPNV